MEALRALHQGFLIGCRTVDRSLSSATTVATATPSPHLWSRSDHARARPAVRTSYTVRPACPPSLIRCGLQWLSSAGAWPAPCSRCGSPSRSGDPASSCTWARRRAAEMPPSPPVDWSGASRRTSTSVGWRLRASPSFAATPRWPTQADTKSRPPTIFCARRSIRTASSPCWTARSAAPPGWCQPDRWRGPSASPPGRRARSRSSSSMRGTSVRMRYATTPSLGPPHWVFGYAKRRSPRSQPGQP